MLAGMLGGALITVYGGYEIGKVINNNLGIEGLLRKGAVDVATMGTMAIPVIDGLKITGHILGSIFGGISHPFIETAYKGYNYFKRD